VPDYGDAIIAALCRDTTGASVATFDRKFSIKLKKLDLSTTSIDLS
jgi:predicted nucleic acid-binding protein